MYHVYELLKNGSVAWLTQNAKGTDARNALDNLHLRFGLTEGAVYLVIPKDAFSAKQALFRWAPPEPPPNQAQPITLAEVSV